MKLLYNIQGKKEGEVSGENETRIKGALKPAKFVIDFLSHSEFEGYTKDEDWNGFACPYFTFEQAQRLTQAWRENGTKASYNSDSDQFSFQMQDGKYRQLSFNRH